MAATYQEPEFLPWEGRRTPVTFVGGYLGAGKTTAINEVLAAAEHPIAVIVNDAGAINIDAALIRGCDGDSIELTNGCVCCTSLDEMGAALDLIRSRPHPPDHLVVELSGVAEPNEVVPWGSSAGFFLDGVVTVVAADQLVDDGLPRWVRLHLEAQIEAADLLVLMKTDLVDAAAADAAWSRLRSLAPGSPIIDGSVAGRDPGALGRFLAIGGHRNRDASGVPGPSLFDLHETHALPLRGEMTRVDIEALVADLPQRFHGRTVARAKGIVELVDGGTPRLALVQLVGSRLEITPLFDNEHQRPTDLVVITVSPAGQP
ncbi:CobW family GTP-binding protein [Aquihabitans sp. McL0605]|uniref:CobW family GTP-binding protein n=1 Tax=Aquihabitans sp. McL0605 TaxID=3415671 RepID=UPI003CF5FCA0